MPFTLRPEDLSFPDRAAVRLAFSRLVPAPAERVFDVLADHEGWTRWFADFKRAVVTGAEREGIGTRRRVWVGPMRVDYVVGFDLPGWIRPLKGLLVWKFRPLFEKALPNLEKHLVKA